MTTEIILGVTVLAVIAVGVWIDWRIHHLRVVSSMEEKIQNVHKKINELRELVESYKNYKDIPPTPIDKGTTTVIIEPKENSTFTNK